MTLALALVLLVLPAAVVVASDRYSDVPASHVFHDDIDALADSGVTLGCGGGKYCPGANVTRGQMAAFLNRVAALGAGKFPLGHAQSRLQTYCAIAEREPAAYPLGPCRHARTVVSPDGEMGGFNSLAIGSDGLPIIAYRDATGDYLRVTHCGNEACTAGNETFTIGASGNTGRWPSIAIGADGLPVIAYVSGGALAVAKCATATCDGTPTITSITGTTNATYVDMALGSTGLPVISYHDSAAGDLEVVQCANAACTLTLNPPASVASTGDVGRFSSIVVGTDGLPVISFEDETNGSLKVARCGDAGCSDQNVITTVDESNVGQYSSIVIGVDGIPVVSYYDATNLDLKVVHCGTADCTSGRTVTTVAADSNVGWSGSIAIGADGLPVIAHAETTGSRRLLMTRCDTVTCTTASTVTVIDALGSGGSSISTAVGVDGLPILSFYDVANTDLTVVRTAAG